MYIYICIYIYIYIYILIAGSLSEDTNTTLWSNYMPIKRLKDIC